MLTRSILLILNHLKKWSTKGPSWQNSFFNLSSCLMTIGRTVIARNVSESNTCRAINVKKKRKLITKNRRLHLKYKHKVNMEDIEKIDMSLGMGTLMFNNLNFRICRISSVRYPRVPIFAHLRRNAPWQRQPCANWKTYLTIIYDTNVSIKGTMHFDNLFPFRIVLPWITPGRFHIALMTSYPIIVHQDWRGIKLGKVYYKICFSFQNIVITVKNTLKWFYVNVLTNLWFKKLI